ncbi:MAG: efflux RND transporter permease subunit [Planctomycetes bacterium]|nr:efflux RND transporter permease subunit [Planctomycetota bacterium]
MTASPARITGFSGFVVSQSKAILFLTGCLCLAGVLSALTMPSSVFPQTNFPRVVILIDNGVMPGDQMTATVTRPVEEAMKDIPGVVSVRSATGRGSAEVNVFFDWSVDMQKSELHVHSRLSQIRSTLPATATTTVHRLTFSAFPIVGLSLTSTGGRSQADLWNRARYDIKPRLLRVPGVARVDLVGGRMPEYHVRVDPLKLESYHLALNQVSDALLKGNLIGPAGLHDEDRQLYLTVVDARVKSPAEIAELVIAQSESGPVRIKDVADVVPGQEPRFDIVSADGGRAVLLNVRSQPEGSTVAIADDVEAEITLLRKELPPDIRVAVFYDQSLLVRESVGSVWESILFGLFLSVAILFGFLKSGQPWATTATTTAVAVVVIPVTVLAALVVMKLLGMSFNLMTLGGIAAAIGLVIDDAIVVVESISAHVAAGKPPLEAVALSAQEVTGPLVGSTLTPVVVFIPLAFIDGIQGVFFRALAVTMVVSLLTSLVLAVALTPTLAARFIRVKPGTNANADHELGGPILRRLIRVYEWAARLAIRWAWFTAGFTFLVFVGTAGVYFLLKQDFLPEMDEGAFVIDYQMPPGTALSETDRVLKHVEKLLLETPEVESYSRRTGARLALAVAEPHRGDFLVKLKPDRKRSVDDVKDDLRDRIHAVEPVIEVDMPGILGDLIGDLTWSPKPIEIKVFSADVGVLKEKAGKIAELIDSKDGGGVDGVVDVNNGLMYTGSALVYRPRWQDLMRYGVKSDDVARTLNTALLGETPSAVLEGDRLVNIRLLVDPKFVRKSPAIDALLVRSELGGAGTRVSAVASRRVEAGQLELRREDLRQNVAVTARTSNRDLGSAIRDIQAKLDKEMPDRAGFTLEYGGLYQQQQESFRNLVMVMAAAVLLVFLVLLIEFRSLLAPLAIVWGSMLSLFGVGLALWLTDTSLNIISFLGAIIGLGIVAKNGILMLDRVEHLRAEGMALDEALVRSGRRRLRPVLMTSLAAALGMLPLAYGIGSGADMLKPLAIAFKGAFAVSVLLSLIATPAVYYVLMRTLGGVRRPVSTPAVQPAQATSSKPIPSLDPTEPSGNGSAA